MQNEGICANMCEVLWEITWQGRRTPLMGMGRPNERTGVKPIPTFASPKPAHLTWIVRVFGAAVADDNCQGVANAMEG